MIFRFITACLATIALTIPAHAGEAPQDLSEWCRKVTTYDDTKRDYFELVASECIKTEPPREVLAEAYDMLGRAKFDQGMYLTAIKHYNRAVQLDKKAEYLSRLSWAYIKTRNYTKAASTATKAIQIDPEATAPYYCRGSAHYYLDRYDKALKDYEAYVERFPTAYNGHLERGVCLDILGKHEEARDAWKRCIELDPDRPQAYHHIGYQLREQNKPQESIEHFTKAIALDGEYVYAWYKRAQSHADLGEYGKAADDMRTVVSISQKNGWGFGDARELLEEYERKAAETDSAT